MAFLPKNHVETKDFFFMSVAASLNKHKLCKSQSEDRIQHKSVMKKIIKKKITKTKSCEWGH